MKKKKETFWKTTELILTTIILLFGIFLMVEATEDYYRGFHNVDLVFNNCLIANDINVNFRLMNDSYDIGKSMPLTDLYIIGNKQMEKAFFKMMFGTFLTAVSLMILIDRREK